MQRIATALANRARLPGRGRPAYVSRGGYDSIEFVGTLEAVPFQNDLRFEFFRSLFSR